MFKEELTPILYNHFHKVEEERILPNLFYEAILPRGGERGQTTTVQKKKDKYRQTSLMNINRKILNQVLANKSLATYGNIYIPCPSGVYSWETSMLQYSKINPCIPPY